MNDEKLAFLMPNINIYLPLREDLFSQTSSFQWRDVARELNGVIRIGAVNCQDDWSLCNMQGIQSYPSLRIYPTVSIHGYFLMFHSNKYLWILIFNWNRY